MAVRYKYSDISKTGQNLTNVDSVVDSINNILHTRVGEHLFNREFGSRIEDYLHEPYSLAISRLILSEAIGAISKWEKRVKITPDSTVEMANDPETRTYTIKLFLEIEGFSDVLPVEEALQAK